MFDEIAMVVAYSYLYIAHFSLPAYVPNIGYVDHNQHFGDLYSHRVKLLKFLSKICILHGCRYLICAFVYRMYGKK